MKAGALLARLAAGEPIPERVAVVVSHADDESIGMGGRLNRLSDLTLILVTDGAPADGVDAKRASFEHCKAYAHEREREQKLALAALGVRCQAWRSWSYPDQGCVDVIAAMAPRLSCDLRGFEAVITHPYEGGHPDHDACALAVQLACAALGDAAPVRLEFAGYHGREGAMVAQRFWPDPAHPAVEAALSAEDIARKTAAFAAYVTQADVIANFFPDREAYRMAPVYDFTRPPPPGAWLYDGFGFELKGRAWLDRAAASMTALKLQDAVA